MAYKQSANTGGNSVGTLVGPASTGVASGDIVLTICTYDASNATLAVPTGFTALDGWTNTVDGQQSNTAYKVAGATEPATYDWTQSVSTTADWVIGIVVLSGRKAAAPTKAAVNLMDTASASPQTVGFLTLTAVAGDDLVVTSAPDVQSLTAVYTWTAPTNYTLRQNATHGASNVFIGTRDNVAAGATGTVNGTLSWDVPFNGGWGAVQYAFAVSGGTTFNQAVSWTATSTVVLGKQVKATRSWTTIIAPTITKKVAKSFSLATLWTSALAKQILLGRTWTTTLAPSLAKQVNAARLWAASIAPTVTKQIAKSLSWATTLSASTTAIKVKIVIVAYAISANSWNVAKQIGAIRPWNVTTSLTSTKQVGAVRTVSVGLIVAVTKSVSLVRTFAVGLSPSVTKSIGVIRSISASFSFVVSAIKSLALSLQRGTASVSDAALGSTTLTEALFGTATISDAALGTMTLGDSL